MSSSPGLSWQQAIIRILGEAEAPLDHHEIAERILEKQLRTTTGRTPAATVSSELGKMIRARARVGREVIQRTPSGYARTLIAEAAAVEDEEELGDSDKTAFINAYGLNWGRSLVNWQTRRGSLWGYQTNPDDRVDFADQDGIYLLHHGNEIVYVGQTRTTRSDVGLYGRMRSHNADIRKTGRWDAFSWFGFKPVNQETGLLEDAAEYIPIRDVITLIETILTESLLPRLNMRSGDYIRLARESRLYFQWDALPQ